MLEDKKDKLNKALLEQGDFLFASFFFLER